MKYWHHSSVNSPQALKRLRRQFGLQYYYFFPSFDFWKRQLSRESAIENQLICLLFYFFKAKVNPKREKLKRLFAFGSEGGYLVGRKEFRYVYQMEVCFVFATTHVSMLSPSNTVCTGRQPIRGCFAKYLLVRNLFFSTLAKSRTSSPDVV